YHGLLDPAVMKQKRELEKSLRPMDLKPADDPWERIEAAQEKLRDVEIPYYAMERGDVFDSRLFRIARHLVRLAAELPKPDAARLPEYRAAALESLKFQLFSPAPISKEYQQMKLASS